MKIEFINHACYLLQTDQVSLLADPWLEGTAFHNGWALIELSKFPYDRFQEVTHIWFSHEHPDHFSPLNLKKIPETERERITILFQKTKDRKVIDYCRSIGFQNIRELGTTWERIEDDFSILNVPHTDGDSWLCVKAAGKILLNLNDCNLETDKELHEIARRIGQEPDILFTQFSYANSIGNRPDTALRAQFARAKIEEIRRQIRILRPSYVVPFASFVWFCHEENFFRNDAINTVDKIHVAIAESGAAPIVLYTGDCWTPDAEYDNKKAIAQWQQSYAANIRSTAALKAVQVEASELTALAQSFINRLKDKNSFLIQFWLKPTNIYVVDHEKSYRLSLDGFMPSSIKSYHCDVQMGSEALAYCFKYEWGGSTTRINGRYEVPPSGKFWRFKRYFLLSQLNNQGETLGISYVGNIAKNKVQSLLLK